MAGEAIYGRCPRDADNPFVMKEQLQAIVTVLSLVNPAICGAMFAQIEENRSRGEQMADATKAALATTVILTVSALIGTRLLHLLGVSLDAFMVAGGGVLAWMGFSMLSGRYPHRPRAMHHRILARL